MSKEEYEKKWAEHEKYFDLIKSEYGLILCKTFDLGIASGWFTIVDKLLWNLDSIIATINCDKELVDLSITQIKQKFGRLSVYFVLDHSCDESLKKETYDLISKCIKKAEDECSITCEECGSKQGKIGGKYWISVRCEKCRKDE